MVRRSRAYLSVATYLLLWAALSLSTTRAQDLSTTVYPSEDELLEALEQGEIDLYQYLRAREAIQYGVDSLLRFYYDVIPNLSSFDTIADTLEAPLEGLQREAFAAPDQRLLHGEFRFRGIQELHGDEREAYRTDAIISRGNWSGQFKIHREFSGRERFVGRHVRYANRAGSVGEIVVGSFSRRFGLGTVFGYRGKFLSLSAELDLESLAYPDYGGYNGLLVRLRKPANVTGVYSQRRDQRLRFTDVALHTETRWNRWRVSLIANVSELRNRLSGQSRRSHQLAINNRRRYTGGYVEAEIAGQAGDFGTDGAGIVEGRHRFRLAELRYAAWVWGEEYLDLSSGGKSASIRRRVTHAELDLEYLSKYAGQEGLLLRSILQVWPGTRLVASLLHGRFDADTNMTEMSVAIAREIGEHWLLMADVLNSERHRARVGEDRDSRRTEARFEARYSGAWWRARAYIGHTDREVGRSDYWSWFVSTDLTLTAGRLRFWSNVGRIVDGRLEYWYGFIEYAANLGTMVQLVSKLADSYSRLRSSDRHRPTLSVTLRMIF